MTDALSIYKLFLKTSLIYFKDLQIVAQYFPCVVDFTAEFGTHGSNIISSSAAFFDIFFYFQEFL